jgi:hypothetical protein
VAGTERNEKNDKRENNILGEQRAKKLPPHSGPRLFETSIPTAKKQTPHLFAAIMAVTKNAVASSPSL